MAEGNFVHAISPDPEKRERDDFYPTPAYGIEALLCVEKFEGTIWEPACGDGAISRVLETHGHTVYSSDLIDRGYGDTNRDFLLDFHTTADNIITNPPFKLAEEFVAHALARTSRKVALLCRLAWLEGAGRRKMFISTPIARVWVFSSRLQIGRGGTDFGKGGGGMIAFAWFVFDHAHEGPPTLGWLP